MRTIKRGDVVYDVADHRHHGIVKSLHLLRDYGKKNSRHRFFANVQWLESGWHSYRVPLADLRLVRDQSTDRTECDVLRSVLTKGANNG